VAVVADIRRAIAEAEYRGLLDLDAVGGVLSRGRPGSSTLRSALLHHRPELAATRSVLEERFVELCEVSRIPLPLVNVEVCGLTVDAIWHPQRVIVELDGHAAHATPVAIERDRRRELRLRAAGYLVLRYTWRQITQQPELVASDMRAALADDPSGTRVLRTGA
jgi:hypothetical protein